MPELPEVETIKRQLNSEILNKPITKVTTSSLKLHGKNIPTLDSLITQSFKNIYRRNKYLVLETEKDFLVIHLGMTGQLISASSLPVNSKHIHMVIHFDNSLLYYNDVRRFGSIHLYEKVNYPDYLQLPLFKNLGYEPLDPSFSLKNVQDCIKKSKTNSKAFIMDGSYICGIGNIYASEILFLSKINPTTFINKVSLKKQKMLYQNIVSVLSQAVQLGGSTISDFIHLNGSSGKMQNYYYVYGRDGKECKVCSTIIEKIKQNGRTTYYCPCCQKK